MNPRPPFLSIALALLVTTTSGCDLFDSDTVITATGRVVLAETGEPISGLRTQLYSFSLQTTPRDSARTDADGRFSLRYDTEQFGGRRLNYGVQVNVWPYVERYTGWTRGVFPGNHYDFGTIELERREEPRP